MDGDIVIRGGTLIDGTGSPRPRADVAVTGGRIVGRGRRAAGPPGARRHGPGRGPRVHRHPHPLRRPGVLGPLAHPVVVPRGDVGHRRELRLLHRPHPPRRTSALLARTLQHVEDMSFDTLSVGVPWDEFETFPQYLDAIARRGTALNYGCYVGSHRGPALRHGRGRLRAGRQRGEVRKMQAVVAEAMAAGAAGFATSASPTHNGDGGRPVPSRVADLDELRALLAPLRARRQGVVALLPGGVISHRERLRPPARRGPADHVDGPAHGEGLPVPREGGRGERRGPGRRASRCGPRCRAGRSCSR